MRILHTSDWHLGASHCDRSRAIEHAAFLDWLLAEIAAREIDALVVAGDVFDTANPSAEALSLYYRFLARLSSLGGRTASGGRRTAIVVGGNHDSPARLDAPRDALAAIDAVVVGGYDAAREGQDLADAAGVLVPLRDASGEVAVVVAAVPFLNDWRLGVRGFDASAEEQLASMHDRFADVYTRLADAATARFPAAALVATGHLTCLAQRGARTTAEDAVPFEINRVGTLGALAPSIFDARFRYVALGHVHRGFPVDARVRYSGTPLQVSAVEGADDRHVLVVDVDREGARVEKVRVPVTRRLVRVAGPIADVGRAIEALRWPEGELDPYVTVEAVLDAPDAGAERAIRDLVARRGGPRVELVGVRTGVRASGVAPDGGVEAASLEALTPERAFLLAWRSRHEGAPPEAVMQRFRSLVEAAAGGREVAS